MSEQTKGHAASAALAVALWVIVVVGLLYGIAQTAAKVPALFGG
ncbi:MAG: MFS transporter small subunit [Egibacteraceae bacterium]